MIRTTLGVEEEYLLLDASTGDLRPLNADVLKDAVPALAGLVHPELMRSEVEVSTPVCSSLNEVERELRGLRGRLNDAAARHHCRLGATGTHPGAGWHSQRITPKDRYLAMAERYQQTAAETVICGCHVHVGVEDPELRIRVMNRIRPWLPVVLALSANSPFWGGDDTGYASYRTMVFREWPMSGMPQRFSGVADYEDTVAALVRAGAVDDATHLYWHARPSARFATLEVRVADVCMTVDEAVTVTGLLAALAHQARREIGSADPEDATRQEVLEAAVWRAARYGLTECLVDPTSGELRPARAVVDQLLSAVRPVLEESGDWQRVRSGVEAILATGNGADRQRTVRRNGGSLADVARYIADQTAA